MFWSSLLHQHPLLKSRMFHCLSLHLIQNRYWVCSAPTNDSGVTSSTVRINQSAMLRPKHQCSSSCLEVWAAACEQDSARIWPPLAKKALYNPITGEASVDLMKWWAPVKQRSCQESSTGRRRPAGTYLRLHQIDPLGAQLSHAVKYINHTFVLCHVKHDVNGNKAPCSPSPSTGKKKRRQWGSTRSRDCAEAGLCGGENRYTENSYTENSYTENSCMDTAASPESCSPWSDFCT